MNRLVINADLGQDVISRHIYGHFAEHLGRCIYEGLWVGEDSPIPNTRGIRNDVVGALKKLNIPNIRWPGGCFADTYHWMDGIGPREKRPSIVNVYWGGVTENNHFGTHEFMDLCEMLNCEPYICGNVGSGTVKEMAQWLEYLTMPGQSPMSELRRANGRDEPWKLKYWSVGNENWGCGGEMRPQYYADLYRQFACYCRNFAGDKLYKVACGFMDEWNEVLMREAGAKMDGLSIHFYAVPEWKKKGSATQFNTDEWFAVMAKAKAIEKFVGSAEAIMDRYDPAKRVGMMVDEWGTWFDVEPGTNPGFLYQQSSMRDAVVAGMTLNIFNAHCRRIQMANIAQTVNVLQSMCLTRGKDMLCTPTYHVFEMYKVHQDATLLPANVQGPVKGEGAEALPLISASASRDAKGRVNVSLCNLDPEKAQDIKVELRGQSVTQAGGRMLAGKTMTAHNTFEKPETVKPAALGRLTIKYDQLKVKLPPASVVVIELS